MKVDALDPEKRLDIEAAPSKKRSFYDGKGSIVSWVGKRLLTLGVEERGA